MFPIWPPSMLAHSDGGFLLCLYMVHQRGESVVRSVDALLSSVPTLASFQNPQNVSTGLDAIPRSQQNTECRS